MDLGYRKYPLSVYLIADTAYNKIRICGLDADEPEAEIEITLAERTNLNLQAPEGFTVNSEIDWRRQNSRFFDESGAWNETGLQQEAGEFKEAGCKRSIEARQHYNIIFYNTRTGNEFAIGIAGINIENQKVNISIRSSYLPKEARAYINGISVFPRKKHSVLGCSAEGERVLAIYGPYEEIKRFIKAINLHPRTRVFSFGENVYSFFRLSKGLVVLEGPRAERIISAFLPQSLSSIQPQLFPQSTTGEITSASLEGTQALSSGNPCLRGIYQGFWPQPRPALCCLAG